MKISGYFCIFIILVIVLLCTAGCTAPQPATVPTATPAGAAPVQTYPTSIAARTVQAADIDTTVNVRFNDIACIDVQSALGVTYLYPDQKFKFSAASPGPNTINVNVLMVDENDNLALRQVKPQWNDVQKVWSYPGVVPVVQFNDITIPVEKSFTIKKQSKYYICADDRKESGNDDITYRVPVKLTRL